MDLIARLLPSLLNLRVFAAGLALWIAAEGALPPSVLAIRDSFDSALLRIGLDLGRMPKPVTPVTVIHIPPVDYERWTNDFSGAAGLQQLLNQLPLESGEVLLGLVLERPLSLVRSEAESLLAEVHSGRGRTTSHYSETQTLLDRRAQLLDSLRAENVVVGVSEQYPAILSNWRADNQVFDHYPPFLQEWLWPWPNRSQAPVAIPVPAIAHYPVLTSNGLELPLLHRTTRGVAPGFALQFLLADARQRAVTQVNTEVELVEQHRVRPRWSRSRGIELSQSLYPLTYDGTLIPLYGTSTQIRAPLRQLSLTAALSADDLHGWVLVGRDSSSTLDRAAQTLAVLGDDAYLTTPYWWSPVAKASLVMLALWMVVVTPLLRWRWAVSSVVFLGVSLATINIIAHLHWGWWLSVGSLLVYLSMAVALMLLWHWRHGRWLALYRRADEADCRWAEQLLAQGDGLAATQNVRSCRTSERVLEILYNSADSLYRGGSYQAALDTLIDLRRRRRRYRDVPQKILTLQALVAQEQRESSAVLSSSALPQPLEQTQALASSALIHRELGRYQVQEVLGRGASGTVYLGFDPRIARPVAIKALDYSQFDSSDLPDIKARFFREAEAAGRLNHPSIVQVFDVGETENLAYIAMDYARGRPLSDYVLPARLLPPEEVYRIILNVAEALAYAHAQNLVHRDIKPANVIYCHEPFQVKVTDFGIVRMVDHAHTRTGEILGSPLYMAPEQLQGQKVSASADIFSLGVTFYQLLCGRTPFNGENLATLSYDVVHNKHRSVRSHREDLPSSATRITNMALQKRPGDRYSNAADMAEALRKAAKRDFGVDW